MMLEPPALCDRMERWSSHRDSDPVDERGEHCAKAKDRAGISNNTKFLATAHGSTNSPEPLQ
jgi:hypothetical protein